METDYNWLVYFSASITVLLAISELLTLIPSVKSNGVFQLIVNIIKFLATKKTE